VINIREVINIRGVIDLGIIDMEIIPMGGP
jgi:hypothetical protein